MFQFTSVHENGNAVSSNTIEGVTPERMLNLVRDKVDCGYMLHDATYDSLLILTKRHKSGGSATLCVHGPARLVKYLRMLATPKMKSAC